MPHQVRNSLCLSMHSQLITGNYMLCVNAVLSGDYVQSPLTEYSSQ